jgi:hypothetical protein
MKKKSVIILDYSGGSLTPRRLANQLWVYASVYAYCLEKSYKIKNYSFCDYYKYFELRVGNFLIKLIFFDLYFLIKKTIPQKAHRALAYYHRRIFRILIDFIEKNHKKQTVIAPDSNEPEKHYLPPSKTTDKTVSDFDKNNNKTLYLDGWMFRNPAGLKKYHKEITEYFRPINSVNKQIKDFLDPLRSSYEKIIGVHFRQGDFRRWKKGKYYLSEKELYNNILSYYKKFNNKTKNTCFVVCSDENVDLENFTGINIFKSCFTNPVHDLFLLASTNTIIGSNSTFGAFASYYGNIPMIVMQKSEIDWEYYKNKNNYFENKYCTNIWY